MSCAGHVQLQAWQMVWLVEVEFGLTVLPDLRECLCLGSRRAPKFEGCWEESLPSKGVYLGSQWLFEGPEARATFYSRQLCNAWCIYGSQFCTHSAC